MSRAARVSAIACFFILLLLGTYFQADRRSLTATSYGAVPEAHGAFYELLRELGLPVARSLVSPERLAPAATIWWIEPGGLARAAQEPDAEPGPLAGDAFARWIEAGGTAVVWLPEVDEEEPFTLAGLSLPERDWLEARTAAAAEGTSADEPTPAVVDGALTARPRSLELRDPRVFAEGPAPGREWERWRVVARLDGQPFVIARPLGAGHLVVGADPRFLRNRELDRADSALLAVDLVRAYGTPLVDEHEHGFTTARGALAYLARSPASAFFVGLALLALAVAWAGAAEPPRRVREADPDAPTLESFVDSLARLYTATGDHGRAFERYREVAARRLRRHFGMPPDASLQSVLERLARRRRLPGEGLELLAGGGEVRRAADLDRAVAALDRLVEQAVS